MMLLGELNVKELVKSLATEFEDKEYAHSYLEDFSNMEIAAQIKVLREQRGLTQKELAELANMKQERVSKLEDVNYDAWTVKTLRKLALAFDVGIKVSFETISNRILDIDALSKKELERTSRDEDLKFFGRNGFSCQESAPILGSVVLTTSQNRITTQSVPANDSWQNFSESKTSVHRLFSN